MYKSAFLGCGPRAMCHADAYRFIKQGRMVAACDANRERLQQFGDRFGIQQLYTDLIEMLDKEKPDLLHIVTPPNIRHSLMSLASDHKVPAVIVEKPIAIQGEDWRDLLALSQRTTTKFVVNTQLHFHPRNLELKRDVLGGRIGDVKFIDASARSTAINQGPHVIQLVSSYISNSRPKKVFAQCSVGGELYGSEPSADNAVASVTYENGVRATLMFGLDAAPLANKVESKYMHKRVAVYGTKGFVHWQMFGWERFTLEGGYESGLHDYGEQDVLGQAGLTEAVFDWLGDSKKVHPTHLPQSLAEFNLIMGIYVSGMKHKPLDLPFDPPNGLIASLESLKQ